MIIFGRDHHRTRGNKPAFDYLPPPTESKRAFKARIEHLLWFKVEPLEDTTMVSQPRIQELNLVVKVGRDLVIQQCDLISLGNHANTKSVVANSRNYANVEEPVSQQGLRFDPHDVSGVRNLFRDFNGMTFSLQFPAC